MHSRDRRHSRHHDFSLSVNKSFTLVVNLVAMRGQQPLLNVCPFRTILLTTLRTLFSVCAGTPFPALQSSPRYGADTTTESMTTMLVPSH